MQMQENARNQLKETEESQRQLESNWDNDKQKKQTWWNEWRKKQSYTDALSKIGLIMNQALLFNTIVAFCNVNAYQNGGIPDQTCARTVFSGQPIAYEDIEVLINFKNTATMPQRISINAVIPTHPQYRGDKGFIDIGKIMSGEKVKFQLPVNNQTWLDQFNWLPGISSELETSVLYVKSFNLYLPPRYSTFMTKQTDVTVNVDFGGISSYGLALKGKRFAIPPLTFVTKYEQRPKDEVFFCEHVNLPNYDCNSFMPIVCATNYEIEEDELSPSLFSTFDVSASFDNGGSGSPIKYSNVTSTMYLSARLTVDLYQNVQPLETQESSMNGAIRKLEKIENRLDENTSKKDANKQSSQPRQRLRALEEIQRCCEVGFYRDWNTGKCIACPVGSISQIGGLYCVGLEKLTLITNNTVLADQ
jgi:hypothetical protein